MAEIGKLALMFTLWSRVEEFVYNDKGIEPLNSLKEEKKHRAILLESETYLVALLCLLNNDYYSASGLVDAWWVLTPPQTSAAMHASEYSTELCRLLVIAMVLSTTASAIWEIQWSTVFVAATDWLSLQKLIW